MTNQLKKSGFYYNLVFRQLTDKDTKEHDEAQKKKVGKNNSTDDTDDDNDTGNNNDVSDVATTSESD